MELNSTAGINPKLFPHGFEKGYEMTGHYHSQRQDVQAGLFLRKFGVPYWAIVKLHGRNIAFWYRLEKGIGRNSIVGTTVKTVPVECAIYEYRTDSLFSSCVVANPRTGEEEIEWCHFGKGIGFVCEKRGMEFVVRPRRGVDDQQRVESSDAKSESVF